MQPGDLAAAPLCSGSYFTGILHAGESTPVRLALILERYRGGYPRPTKLYVDDFFHRGEVVLLTITSSGLQMAVMDRWCAGIRSFRAALQPDRGRRASAKFKLVW